MKVKVDQFTEDRRGLQMLKQEENFTGSQSVISKRGAHFTFVPETPDPSQGKTRRKKMKILSPRIKNKIERVRYFYDV